MDKQSKTVEEITAALAAPFDASEVKHRAGAISGSRALALAYVDARVIQDRLDEVLGVVGWQDDYTVLDGCSVTCRLRLRIGDEWVTKQDVGSVSEQPDEGDRMKAAFSDALKRAAVKFGLGRYLYRLPAKWVDWDAQRKCFKNAPTMPAEAPPEPAPMTPVEEWADWLRNSPTLKDFNRQLREELGKTGEHKKAIWARCVQHAAERKWAWNEDVNAFQAGK